MDLICFSHLRWDFVFQRPQHLLTKFSAQYRVFYIEEPFYNSPTDRISLNNNEPGIYIVQMHLCGDGSSPDLINRQKKLLVFLFDIMNIQEYILWFYTPMALPLTDDLSPELMIYDCMDELANFKFAPDGLKELERILISRSHLVFTGGKSLYNSKKDKHNDVYCFPSSIDKDHFGKAQKFLRDPDDQKNIPHPRLGFFGVLDERLDTALLKNMSEKKPDWHFIMIGPVVKISDEDLPRSANIHYLGPKSYDELPDYLSGWDIALLPFAINESTKFISPTKTPEYLAALKPVVSSPINDVVNPYGKLGLVEIAENADGFINSAERLLNFRDKKSWMKKVQVHLSQLSWDQTFYGMQKLISEKIFYNKFLKEEKEYG